MQKAPSLGISQRNKGMRQFQSLSFDNEREGLSYKYWSLE